MKQLRYLWVDLQGNMWGTSIVEDINEIKGSGKKQHN